MFQTLYHKYFDTELPTEVKVFNTNHVIINISILIAIVLALIFVPDLKATFFLAGTLMLGIITFLEANRTGRYLSCSVVMSLVLNLATLPYLMYAFHSLICCIPIYCLLGIVYTIIMVPKWQGVLLAAFEILVHAAVIALGFRYIPANILKVTLFDAAAVTIGVLYTGILTGITIRYRLLVYKSEQQLAEQTHIEAMDAYIAEDMFLINMSHEIRTPMNAILGTTELLLDLNVNGHVRDNIYSILNYCNALLSITNDLLDLSKSESGKIQVFNTEYNVAEIFTDIINMMSVRLMDSSVKLYVDIDGGIPYKLYGDGVRLRQVFINILNNAVKYTKRGSITLRITQEKSKENDNIILLKADVIDTGIGIKEESLSKLFSVYQRVEEGEADRRSIEGTGLGLSICREILSLMNGEISVKSVYKEGSTFSFVVPQTLITDISLVQLETSERPSILIFEENEEMQQVLFKIICDIGYSADCAQNKVMFGNLLSEQRYTHIFIAQKRYQEVKAMLDEQLTTEHLVVISNINQTPPIDKFGSILMRPLYCINVAAIFSHEGNKSIREVIKKGGFICPEAHILVVDDNLTNLNVVSGLLRKYEADVITATSGAECLATIQQEKVDLIFLDYMMPEMDGIDTLLKMREIENEDIQKIHVIALTANVISGAREMFMEAGFDDYISKPVEIDKIERALKTHLPHNLNIGKNQ